MPVMLESFPVDFLKNLEDFNEEIDDVEVQLDGRHNVFLGTQSGHNHLSVKDDEEREEESSSHCHCCLCQLTPNEDIHEATKDEDKKASVQCSSDVGEVPLGLEGEGGQADNHGSSQEECLNNNGLVKEGDQNSNSVCLNHSESSKEDEVDGSLLALDMEGNKETHGEEKGREKHPGVALHRLLHSRGEQQDRTYYGGYGQLDCQEPIHLPHETKSDVLACPSNVVVVAEV